jgi:hypothetical protein
MRESTELMQKVAAERTRWSRKCTSKIEHPGSDLEYCTIIRYALAYCTKQRKLERGLL